MALSYDWSCKFSNNGLCGRGGSSRHCEGKKADRKHCPEWNKIDTAELGSVIAHALNGIYIPDEVEP